VYGEILEEVHAFLAVVLLGSAPSLLSACICSFDEEKAKRAIWGGGHNRCGSWRGIGDKKNIRQQIMIGLFLYNTSSMTQVVFF
jgi:hypothetical protein